MENNYSTPKNLHILHFNDAYEAEKNPPFGAEFLERARPSTLKIFSGDLFFPSLLSIFFKGRQMVPLLEKLAIDYGIIGNHDVERGDKAFRELTKTLQTKWLLCNFKPRASPETIDNDANYCECLSFDIKIVNGIKVGLFGLLDKDWIDASNLTLEEYCFIDPVAKAREVCKFLRGQNCELVIALTHMSNKSDDLLLASDADFDISLGGHEHVYYVRRDNQKVVLKSGFNFDNFSDLTIELSNQPLPKQTLSEDGNEKVFQFLNKKNIASQLFDFSFSLKRAGYFVNVKIHRVDIDKNRSPDPDLLGYINKLSDEVNRKQKKPICFFLNELDIRSDIVRARESDIANLLTDIVKIKLEVDVVFLQGGSIRSETKYPPETVFYMADLIKMVPYMNVFYIHNVKGSDLKVLFEQGYVSLPNALGSFLHLSGAAVKVDSAKKPLERISTGDIEIINNTFEANKIYRVAALDFISKGKDGYTKFKEVECIGLESSVVILATAFKTFCKLPNKEENRIEFKLLKKHFKDIDSHELYLASKSKETKHYRLLTEHAIENEGEANVLKALKIECVHRLMQYLLAEDIILKEGKWVFALKPELDGRIKIS